MSKETITKGDRFKLGDKVLAPWTDGRRYPGQINEVTGMDTYIVLFEDGVKKSLKGKELQLNLKPIPRLELPFLDAREQREIHDSDNVHLFINCYCGSEEDTGFFVQCDQCFTFHHADCYDVKTDADLFQAITCYICLNPKGLRESCRYKVDHSWLKESTLPNLLPKNEDDLVEVDKRITMVNFLLEATLECLEVLHGLRAKFPLKEMKVDSSKELLCWSKSWLTTDFENLSENKKIENETTTPLSVKSTPTKVKGKSAKKPRSNKKDKRISKVGGNGGDVPNLDKIKPCPNLNSKDSNQPPPVLTNGSINDENVESSKKIEPIDMNKSLTAKNLSTCSKDLDSICQRNLDEHIEDIRKRLDTRLSYIESRIVGLEEWYGFNLGANDIEANQTEFRDELKNLHSDLQTFTKIQSLIKQISPCQNIKKSSEIETGSEGEDEDEGGSENDDHDHDEDYQPVAKSVRKKKI